MFEKTLSDLVRGIRAHKSSESQYISQCMAEIKKELKQENVTVKANAVSKLTYLQMLGYDISWAAFNIIEVMSSTKFTSKRIGYLAATQCFHEGLDVVMLTTNMIRKDISSHSQYDSSLALNGLACFMTADLARDLANDVLTLMSHSRPYIRKKAVLVMYRVFLKFPDALRPAFPRLKDRLDDPDTGVQSAAVSVICELARKNPRNYLSLAPTFFKLMTNSTNNWMLIKIIKLFGALTPLEPRLGKKLIEPLTSLIHNTTAMSLLYECISTVIQGMPNHTPSLQLCVSKLRLFVEDADQNLKYLGLLAMAKILQHQPKAVQQHKDLIVECLDDRDESIRLRALDLISGMVSKKNLLEIVKKLMLHIDQSDSQVYRDLVLSKIIAICSHNNYHYLTNFEWYLTVLVEMTRFEGTKQGQEIAAQMLDITIRVKDVRPYAVKQMVTILENSHLFTGSTCQMGICEVLYAAAWIVGEFSEHLDDPRATLDVLLNPKVTALPGHIQSVFVQNIVKLYSSILVKAEAEGTPEAVEEVGGMLVERLPVFIQSGDLEVQERACCILQLMKYIVKLQGKGAAVAEELSSLFAGDLNPVAGKAQRKVPVPEGLDLDKWINEPPSDDEDVTKGDSFDMFLGPSGSGGADHHGNHYSPVTRKRSKKELREVEVEMEKRREQRRQDQLSNPHYLKPSSKASSETTGLSVGKGVDVGAIPVSKLDLGIALIIDEPKADKSGSRKKGRKKGRKGRRKGEEIEEEQIKRPAVVAGFGEMPEGAVSSDDEHSPRKVIDEKLDSALNQNLDAPLRDDEVLPVRQHRIVTAAANEGGSKEEGAGSRKKTKDKKKGRKKGSKRGEEEGEEAVERKGRKKTRKREKEEEEEEDEEEEEEEEEVVEKKEGKKTRKGRKSKKHSTSKQAEGEAESALIDITGAPQEGAVGVAAVATKTVTKATKEVKKAGELDDFEFWLSTDAPAAAAEKPDGAPPVATATAESPEGKTKRKKEKKPKKGGKKHRTKKLMEVGEEEGDREGETATGDGKESELLSLDLSTTAPSASAFKLLAEDENMKMTYEVRANPLYSGQVTVAVVFCNKSLHQLISLEFNVLDSLNTKLERPMGCSPHDGIKVPFHLPAEMANECQFTFYVQSFLVPQKMRGTAIYMIKSDVGTVSDKLDFTVHLPSSAFICPIPCAQQQFASLLGSGSLCDTQTVKVPLTNTANFDAALVAITTTLHLAKVEHIDDSASLYGSSITKHHVCLLVKAISDGKLSINAKCTDAQLVSSLLDEIKSVV